MKVADMLTPETALFCIDIQQGFDDEAHWGGDRNNRNSDEITANLLAFWRGKGLPVIHTIHASVNEGSPLRPELAGHKVRAAAAPIGEEPTFVKNVNSAFIGTNLPIYLVQHNIKRLIMLGFTTNHCVSTTARMASNLGYQVGIVADATVAFDTVGPDGRKYPAETIHNVALTNLHDEFAQIIDSQAILQA